jgi:HSP20 family protein
VLRRARRFGSFVRSINIPRPIKAEDAMANFQNGILIITIPKTAETRPKVIEVNAAANEE